MKEKLLDFETLGKWSKETLIAQCEGADLPSSIRTRENVLTDELNNLGKYKLKRFKTFSELQWHHVRVENVEEKLKDIRKMWEFVEEERLKRHNAKRTRRVVRRK